MLIMRTEHLLTHILLFDIILILGQKNDDFEKSISDKIVTIRQGKLKGLLVRMPDRSGLNAIISYHGIQYASIMGSDFRFMPPTYSIERWSGKRLAVKARPACTQQKLNLELLKKSTPRARLEHFRRIDESLRDQLEDCLSMNIYVPTVSDSNDTKYPVMLFVHGESFDLGSGNAYDASVLASYGQVIVITLNYRLGALGYFESKSGAVKTANHALMDIVAALQWINLHISSFGGDTQKITLVGHGYGAALVNYVSLSIATKGLNLFQRVILQSGAAPAAWGSSYDLGHYSRRLAEIMNCTRGIGGKEDQVVYCMKHKDDRELNNANIKVPKYRSGFGPVVDETQIAGPLENLMKDPTLDFAKVDVMIGVTSNEGYQYLNQDKIDVGVSEEDGQKIIRTFVQNVYDFQRQKVYDILTHYYTKWDTPMTPKLRRDQLMKMLGDGLYVAPMTQVAKNHAIFRRTYAYVMDIPSTSFGPPLWAGSVHGTDLAYLFGAPLVGGVSPFPRQQYSTLDKIYSEAIMTYWTNFAKTGDPNRPERLNTQTQFQNLKWPRYDLDSQFYMNFGRRPGVSNHFRGNKVALWLQLIPKIHKSDPNGDPKAHWLNDHKNRSTFEEGTRFDDRRYFPPPPMPPITPPPYRKPQQSGNLGTAHILRNRFLGF